MSIQPTKSIRALSPYQQVLLIHADSDYVTARVLYYTGSFYPQVLRLCRDALEKYLKLLLLKVMEDRAPQDKEADAYLMRFGHHLIKLREACCRQAKVSYAQGKQRPDYPGHPELHLLDDKRFVSTVEMVERNHYEVSTRYPKTFSFPGSIVQMFDRMIHGVRNWCLELTETTPLEVIHMLTVAAIPEKWPELNEEKWPELNEEFISAAFHHQNKKFLLGNKHVP